MSREDVAAVLAKAFVIQEIDTDRTVHGQEVFEKMRAGRDGGLPWFAVQDGAGRELGTSIGPQGNLGCPYTDAEIETFMGIVAQTAPGLGAEDLRLLRETLLAQGETAQKKQP
jgi:hypothetical protein